MPEVRLVKQMGYERVKCACGTIVLSRDPTPEISETVKRIAIEEKAKFSIADATVETMEEYNISELPAVIIGNKAYGVEEQVIRSAIRRERNDRG